MSGSIAQNLPAINQFLSRTLQTGNVDNDYIAQRLAAMQQQGARSARDVTAQVTGSMPMGSSAAVGALSKGLGDTELQNRLAMMDFLNSQSQQGLSNKMGAFQGMMGLPSYIGSPSSIESAMISSRQPFQLANLGAQQDWMSQLLSGTLGSSYTPELMVQPSDWAQVGGPLISAIVSGLLGRIPMPSGGSGGGS